MAKKTAETRTFDGFVYDVIDGDTIKCQIDLGFGIYTKQVFRLYGINTPELTSKVATEKNNAKNAMEYVESAILDKWVTLEVVKDKKEKYGRYLANVITFGGTNINNELIKRGYAVSYIV